MTQPAMTDGDGRRLIVDAQAALRRVATLIARRASSAEVFTAVADEVAQALNVPAVMLARYEPDRSITVMASIDEPSFYPGSRWSLDGPSVSATVLQTGRSARIDDFSELPGAIAEGVRGSKLRGGVGVPIVVGGELWGVVTIGTRELEPMPPDTEDRLDEFAKLVSLAIANAEARERFDRLFDEQAALRRVATLVAGGATTAELGAALLEEVVKILDLPAGWLVRYDAPDHMTVLASVNDDAFPPGSRWPLEGQSLTATLFRGTGAARIDDYSGLGGEIAERTRASGFVSAVGVPITVEGVTWGAVCVGTRQLRPLPSDTEDRLSQFTELLATAISNVESRDRLHALANEQEALRRVATLVAEAAPPPQIFNAVAEEVGRILELEGVEVVRYEGDGTATVIATSGHHRFDVGSTWPLEDGTVMASVRVSGQPARVDSYESLSGTIGRVSRDAGFQSAIGAPIVVDGSTWGSIVAMSAEPDSISDEAVTRLGLFTELVATAVSNVQAHDDLRGLAEEQAALRRVATLVAEGADSNDLFDVVCAETGRLVGATSVNLSHYTSDGVNITMAGWSLRDTHVPAGSRFPITPDTVAGIIVRTRAPARVDSWDHATSELANLVRERGVRSSLGAPVIVDGQLWGALVAATDREEPLASGTEFRLGRFTELIATAISNVATRTDLMASRARIVAAGDEARRRIERNLHDGTQQRLIALGLDLQRIRMMLPSGQGEVFTALEGVEGDLASVLEDVRELSRGLHPPSLSRGGLAPSLRALARRSPIPVRLEIVLTERPPTPIETALYYVVSEALTNAIKYSQASTISVTITTDHAGGPFGVDLAGGHRVVNVHATVIDDGIGGAAATEGSGLMGLLDRVHALGGRFELDSPATQGTRLSIELPLEPHVLN